MIVKSVRDCGYGRVLDGTLLCELLHPLGDGLEIDFSLAHAILKPGESSLPHCLKESVEVYYILEGEGIMHIDKEERKVVVGDAIFIPPKSVQYIENVGDSILSFLCVVSPPWRREDEKLVIGGHVKKGKVFLLIEKYSFFRVKDKSINLGLRGNYYGTRLIMNRYANGYQIL